MSTKKNGSKAKRTLALSLGLAGVLAAPIASEVRLMSATQPLTDAWQHSPVESRTSTLLGISFRPPQLEVFGLDMRTTLQTLLTYPVQIIRLGAYWKRIEPEPGVFLTDELDWQIDAAEQAGVKIILCVGGLKTFSYPEFFVPAHALTQPLQEGSLIKPSAYLALLTAAIAFSTRIVERYKERKAIVAWQVEHEAVDPLGIEHTWRLDASFVAKEVEAVRRADSTRPIMLNGFLPTSLPVQISQWWQTRDQGDSLAVAQRMADIVGIDYYPCHALTTLGSKTLYLDGSKRPWHTRNVKQLLTSVRTHKQQVMVSEGQAEPWESVTTPPNPDEHGMFSCMPERIIDTYNTWMRWSRTTPLYAYLFWGAEYWMLRQQSGDASYMQAFARILEKS